MSNDSEDDEKHVELPDADEQSSVRYYHKGHLPPPKRIPWELTRPGDLLKFSFVTADGREERMWVSIGASRGDNIIGILVSHPVVVTEIGFGDRIERPKSEAVDFYSERVVESACPTCGRWFKYRPHEVV